ncbi:MAG: hypothetical protein M9890_04025 [Thermomicrobiales bacterium]|nr:hypothetical protein [Thermomicrobiales bacterium]
MANITGILCQVITGSGDGAGTDGDIYLGIGGREFHLDSTADDFERNSWREYILGRAPLEPNLPPPQIRVKDPDLNHPTKGYIVQSQFLDEFPVYVRFESNGDNDHWQIGFVAVIAYTGASEFYAGYIPVEPFDSLWLGYKTGKILYLHTVEDQFGDRVLDRGRLVARTAGITLEQPAAE